MDKYEFGIKVEQIRKLMKKKDYITAVKIADGIDWEKVKDNQLLIMAADVYEIAGRYDDARDTLLLAYERTGLGRQLAYRLCRLSVKRGDFTEAEEFYNEFVRNSPRDAGKYILLYEIAKGKGEELEKQMTILEAYIEEDMDERWAFELAKVYHKARLREKCIEMCDTIILWFADGKYVEKALELKRLYTPLSESQRLKYEAQKSRKAKIKPDLINGGGEDSDFVDEEATVEPKIAEEKKVKSEIEMAKTKVIPTAVVEEALETLMNSDTEEKPLQVSMVAEKVTSEEILDEKMVGEILDEVHEADIDVNDIHIKDYSDNNKYDTINLQRELAQNVSSLFDNTIDIFKPNIKKETQLEESKKDDDQIEGQMSLEEVLAMFESGELQTRKEEPKVEEVEDIKESEQIEENEDCLEDIETNDEENVQFEEIEELEDVEDDFLEEQDDLFDDADSSYIEDEFDEDSYNEKVLGDTQRIDDILEAIDSAIEDNFEENVEEIVEDIIDEEMRVETTVDEPMPIIEESIVEDTIVEEDVEQETAIEESVVEEAIAEETTIEESVVEEDIIEETTIEESVVEEAIAEETTIEENVVEEDISEEHTIEEDGEAAKADVEDNEVPMFEIKETATEDDEEKGTEYSSEEPVRDFTEETKTSQKKVDVPSRTMVQPEMAKEELKNFIGRFAGVQGLDKQILKVMQNTIKVEKAPVKFIFVKGEVKSGKTTLAIEVLKLANKLMQRRDQRIAKIKAETINGKTIDGLLLKLDGSDVLIERVSDMAPESFVELIDKIKAEGKERIVIFEDEISLADAFLEKVPSSYATFANILDIKPNKIKDWTKIASNYAKSQGYGFDEMGTLALSEKIDQLRAITLVVQKDHIEQIVDRAIKNHNKFSLAKLFGRGNAKNEDGLKLLTEKDFMI